jgi:Rrf2 family protein
MKLSRSSLYAINVTLQLARAAPGVPVSSSQLARAGRMPERFLLQVLRRLVEHDVLRSTRGTMGGYVLARRPQQITLFDVVGAVDHAAGSKSSTWRGLKKDARARLNQALQNVSRAANAELQKLTVADLGRPKGRRRRR